MMEDREDDGSIIRRCAFTAACLQHCIQGISAGAGASPCVRASGQRQSGAMSLGRTDATRPG